MSQVFNILPEHETTWSDILKDNVSRPHPTSTKEDLWMWINDHARLLDNLRTQYLDSLKPRVCKQG